MGGVLQRTLSAAAAGSSLWKGKVVSFCPWPLQDDVFVSKEDIAMDVKEELEKSMGG